MKVLQPVFWVLAMLIIAAAVIGAIVAMPTNAERIQECYDMGGTPRVTIHRSGPRLQSCELGS